MKNFILDIDMSKPPMNDGDITNHILKNNDTFNQALDPELKKWVFTCENKPDDLPEKGLKFIEIT